MGTTNPSTTSTRALYLSNWNNMMGVWKAGKLTQLDSSTQGPCLGELHYLGGSLARRDVNQIVEYEGFFRDETNNIKYNQMSNFDCEPRPMSTAGSGGAGRRFGTRKDGLCAWPDPSRTSPRRSWASS